MHSDFENMRLFYLRSDVESVDETKKNEEQSLDPSQISSDLSEYLTIEDLRKHYHSCSNCGVSWMDDHVSLDCSECGGYALCRPCPKCEGQCLSTWKRDVAGSHFLKKAKWLGSCSFDLHWNSSNVLDSNTLAEDKNSNFHRFSHITQPSL